MSNRFVSMWDTIQQIADDALKAQAEKHGVTPEEYLKIIRVQQYEEQQRLEREMRQREEERATAILKELEYRAEFGKHLALPVPAHVGHVLGLNGLSERSQGNGTVRNTVMHVVVDADLSAGRLQRKAGDLLCKPRSKLGKRKTLGITGTGYYRDDVLETWWHDVDVSCEQCKAILGRFKRKV